MNESHFTVRFQDGALGTWGISTTYDLYERDECTDKCDHSEAIATVRQMFEAYHRASARIASTKGSKKR